MTNEQLCVYIQQDNPELIPILWERVKNLCFLLCGRYYSRYAERFSACGVELCDLRQNCYAAFLQAVHAYNKDKGFMFISYLKLPIRNTAAQLLGIRNADRINRRPLDNSVSLDKPFEFDDNEGLTLGDTIPDQHSAEPFEGILDGIEDEYTRQVLGECIKRLTDTQQRVIALYYFENKIFADIGAELGLSGERIRQINVRALGELRNMPEIIHLYREMKQEQAFHDQKLYTPKWFRLQEQVSNILERNTKYPQRQYLSELFSKTDILSL